MPEPRATLNQVFKFSEFSYYVGISVPILMEEVAKPICCKISGARPLRVRYGSISGARAQFFPDSYIW